MSKGNDSPKTIPSQRIVGSNKELFIINYEGSVIEIYRTNNLYEPLIVQLNGKVIESIPSKQNKEIHLTLTDGGQHTLEVWNERINNSPFIKALGKDGIAIVIDGIPVQHTLADPLKGLSKSKIFLWLQTIFLFFISVITPVLLIQQGYAFEYSNIVGAYLFLFIVSLYASLSFNNNSLRSIWIAIIISVLELIYFIFINFYNNNISLYTIVFLAIRLGILSSLIFSLRQIKSILDAKPSQVEFVEKKSAFSFKLTISKIFSKRNILITTGALVLIAVSYFGVPKLLVYINAPPLDRDESIVFRNNLKLPDLIPYREGDKWGYCDRNKTIVIPPIYDRVDNIDNQKEYLVVNLNGQLGVINRKGNKILPFIYTSVIYNSELNNFTVSKDKQNYGVVDNKNTTLLPFEFKTILVIDGYYIVEKIIKDKIRQAILTKNGEIIYDYKFSNFRPLLNSQNLFIASNDVKIKNALSILFSGEYPNFIDGIVDYSGRPILPFSYDILQKFELNNNTYLMKAKKLKPDGADDGKNVGLLDKNASFVIPCEYDDIENSEAYNNFIVVRNNDKRGVINLLNENVIPIKYDGLSPFIRDQKVYFVASLDKKFGLLNEAGEIIVPMVFDFIQFNSIDTYLSAVKDHKWSLIDYKNNKILPFDFESIDYFSDGLLGISKKLDDNNNFKWGFADIKNNIVVDFIYDEVEKFNKGYAIVSLNKKCGVINKKGEILIPIKYDLINKNEYDDYTTTKFNLYNVTVDGKDGYVDINGTEYFEN